MEKDQLATEAQARIIWGDSPESVEQLLRSEGCSRTEAQDLVAACIQERHDYLKGKARKKAWIGFGAVLLSLLAFLWLIYFPGDDSLMAEKTLGKTISLGITGIISMISGVFLIFFPDAFGRKDLSKSDEDD
jgi:hypothetical protein